ncbi:MFS transporter [Coralliovum pocilloporae]|uniref:MFS transporter n=1 Tax=Coralliovum pocilloporae TaxID=3066369 RepID=UPI0033071552
MTQSRSRSDRFGLRFSVFYGSFFLILGFYIPVFPVWLNERLDSNADLSVVLAAPIVAKILFSSVISHYADQHGDRRTALIGCSVMACLIFPLLWFQTGLVFLFLMLFAVSAFWQPLLPLADASAALGARLRQLDYGRIRIWGSLAFIVGTLGSGVLMEAGSADQTFLALAILFAVLAGSAVLLPRLADDVARSEQPMAEAYILPGEVPRWLTGRLIIVMAAAALVQAAHAGIYSFGTLYWQRSGFSGTEIGLLWSVGVTAEILLFFVSKHLRILSPVFLIGLGAALGGARWLIFPFVSGLETTFVLQILHAASFGATHLGIVAFIASQVHGRKAGSAQGLYSTISSVAMAVTTLAAGFLYEAGAEILFSVMAVTSFAGAAILLGERMLNAQRLRE